MRYLLLIGSITTLLASCSTPKLQWVEARKKVITPGIPQAGPIVEFRLCMTSDRDINNLTFDCLCVQNKCYQVSAFSDTLLPRTEVTSLKKGEQVFVIAKNASELDSACVEEPASLRSKMIRLYYRINGKRVNTTRDQFNKVFRLLAP